MHPFRALTTLSEVAYGESSIRKPFTVAQNSRLSLHSLANERSKTMFTRVVEFTAKQGKAREVSSVLSDKVLPILRNQPGFVDAIVLVPTTGQDRLLGLSFWQSADDAERYIKEQYPKVLEVFRPVLETAPRVQTFNVDISTTHKIAAGKAA
jgi:heme-degrading monooxygenase HmoA